MKFFLLATVAIVSLLLSGFVTDPRPPERTTIQIVELDADECSHAPDLYFGPACAYHDKCYYYSWSDRATCDKWFLEDMLEKCDELPLQPTAFCGTQAFAYYVVVRGFGQDYYRAPDELPDGNQCHLWLTERGKRQSLDSHVMIIT